MPFRMLELLKTEIWAAAPSALDALASALRHPTAIPSSQGPDPEPFTRSGGIALLPVTGTLSPDYGYAGAFAPLRTGYKGLRDQFDLAMEDPGIHTLLLCFNSPGGTVQGCKELVDHMASAKAASGKRVVGYVDGACMSAALWLSSVCDELAAPATALVGSIGVLQIHADWSRFNEKTGITFSYLSAGSFKALPNADNPLNDTGRAYVQERLDRMYGIFTESYASLRGLSPEKIRATDGRIYLAEDALREGLVDRITPGLEPFMAALREENMDMNKLKAEHPALYAQIRAEGGDAVRAELTPKISAAGEDILSMVAMVAGPEASGKIRTLQGLGLKADQIKAMADAGLLALGGAGAANAHGGQGNPAGNQANGQGGQANAQTPAPAGQAAMTGPTAADILAALQAATPPGVSAGGQPAGAAALPGGGPDFLALVEGHMAAKACSRGEAMREMQAKHPEAHKAYILGLQKGGAA
ncbi:S49 family peptidase [Desulfobotulus mexicanus]|uniref:S49 family peptidase n=1 Tax=Desulfobotulus mexicanus TaxID=2586642 RepID=A0A5S5MBV8_9BACT|nr:S49 family peptidase [Desulfobotulus mexicanus]TYT73160.1 S49 family peptidase [Desulfobotulus mexicanus]